MTAIEVVKRFASPRLCLDRIPIAEGDESIRWPDLEAQNADSECGPGAPSPTSFELLGVNSGEVKRYNRCAALFGFRAQIHRHPYGAWKISECDG